MNWKYQKYILIATTLILFTILSFILGIAFGSSSNNKQFIDTFIPVLSTIGSWVSGIGALGAVFVALWLSEKQNQRDRENLNINFSFAFTRYDTYPILCIRVVCVGAKPSNINSIFLEDENAGHHLVLVKFIGEGAVLPTKLGYGEDAHYFLLPNVKEEIGQYLKKFCNGSARNLHLYVKTTTETFNLKVNQDMQKIFESHATNDYEQITSTPCN